MDLRSAETLTIPPATTIAVSTGLYVAVPKDWQMNIYSRSGYAAAGIIVANAPGIIDSDYRGEVKVLLHNQSQVPFCIEAGDRIAQAQMNPVYKFSFAEVDSRQDLGETKRGDGGMGSTGK